MTGYHEVKIFKAGRLDEESLALPEGWKPFHAEFVPAGFMQPAYYAIYCRRWHRKGQTLADMQAEVDAA